MYKLVVLFALAAVAAAKPSGVIAPAVAAIAVPSAVSSSYRSDYVVSKPVVAAYAAPAFYAAAPAVVQKTVVAAAPVAVPAAVSSSYRTDVISKPVVATYAAPALVQKTVVAAAPVAVPAAVSSSYRTDVVSKPVVAHYAAPALYAAPVAAYGVHGLGYAAHAPVVHAW